MRRIAEEKFDEMSEPLSNLMCQWTGEDWVVRE